MLLCSIHSVPGGSLQKTVPPPWQTYRNFPERFPPLFTLHIISVFVQWAPNVTGSLCGVQQLPTTRPPTGNRGQRHGQPCPPQIPGAVLAAPALPNPSLDR